ncbi:dTMP kinase [Arcanobacterium hippocoleae]|uniref:Thymidylate kinase n=1 Tax=Arcanobacterium hippocoleae TaxID=149017 RepID=A0ABU1T286_9ACTO|nr:dTMP kinase [Arcanobacterium hippocoleae]MDR6939488.1 dTMP kinase [Arcanobacterium hippocoleae]
MAGLFISFEGGDGAGKSTQVRALADWLSAHGYSVEITREPGGTDLGTQIRQMLLHGGSVTARAEALLYAADRAHHVATKIRPALARGSIVISDRYLDSSVAYQGAARALPKEQIRALSLWAVEDLLPDLTILLDLPVAQGAQRVGAVQDRLEAEGETFHQRVRAEFKQLADADPQRIKILDGQQSIAQISAQIHALVAPLLAGLPKAGENSSELPGQAE